MTFIVMVMVISTELDEYNINADGVNADVFKSNVTLNDIVFNQNDNE